MFSCSCLFRSPAIFNSGQQYACTFRGISADSFVSKGVATVKGKKIAFTATAGETIIKNRAGEPTAKIWSMAYTKSGIKPGENRPVTFIYNGGPGSASAYMLIGVMGPKIIDLPSEADADDGASPYKIINNPNSLLDVTDLVFVDAVGTGYSKATSVGKATDFWSITGDGDSMTKFIREWITINKRWNSPKYLAGISYGTIRASTVAHMLLQDGQPVDLNGLILISPALELAGVTSLNGNVKAYMTLLPTMAVTAKYHGKAGQDLSIEDFAQEAREFARDVYVPALLQGANLPDSERASIAERLAYFTGLDKAFILQSDLRVLIYRFQKELLRQEGQVLGFSDGRYTGEEYDSAASDPIAGDPSGYAVSGAHTAAFNDYLAKDLGVTIDRPYYMYNRDVGNNWDWSANPFGHQSAYHRRLANRLGDIAIAPALATVMRKNQDLRVMVATGYYDLITPFFDAETTFGRHGFVQDRIDIEYYESGHRIHLRDQSREKMNNDMREFIKAGTK